MICTNRVYVLSKSQHEKGRLAHVLSRTHELSIIILMRLPSMIPSWQKTVLHADRSNEVITKTFIITRGLSTGG